MVDVTYYDTIKNSLGPNGTDPYDNTKKYDYSYSFGGSHSDDVAIKVDVLSGTNNEFTYIADKEVKSHIMVVGAIGKPGDNISGNYTTQNFYNTNFSNVGARIDVVAPGKSVRSCAVTGYGDDSGNYIEMHGTSMASPIVAGMAGFMLSVDPGLSCSEVKSALLSLLRNTRMTMSIMI